MPARLPGLFRTASLLFLLAATAVSRAHQPGLSSVSVDLGTNRISLQFIVAWQELENSRPLDSNRDRTLSDEEFAAAKTRLIGVGESAFSLESDGRLLSLKSPAIVQRDDVTGIRVDLLYEFPPTRVLTIHSEIISELQRNHSQIAIIRNTNGATLGEAVLTREKPTVDVPLFATTAPSPQSPVREYLLLGIEHILLGWDHLAFLFGLLIVGGRLRDAVKIITSFTIAHSLTLALATFNVINIPSSVVEPIIAASIVYVGFENIIRDNFNKRWVLTFCFGLIHGCGFASVLRDIGIGADGGSVITPLVCFNLGVEIGQVAIAAIMLPLIWKLKGKFPKRWVPAASAALVVIGSYFLVERIWF